MKQNLFYFTSFLSEKRIWQEFFYLIILIGRFLISFSFELSLIEQKVGTPEVPLSDLGFLTYLSTWSQRIIETLLKHTNEEISINDLSMETAMKQQDIIMVSVLIDKILLKLGEA